MAQKETKSSKGSRRLPRINLADFEKGEALPDLAVYAVDRTYKQLHVAKVDKKGQFDMPAEMYKSADYVVIGPAVEDLSELEREKLITYRPAKFQEMIKSAKELIVAKPIWNYWWPIQRCVSGSVSYCHPYWPYFQVEAILPIGAYKQNISAMTDYVNPEISDIVATAIQPSLLIPHKCEVVCDGVVEVYRRRCCCEPWLIYDPRLPVVIAKLEEIIPEIPGVKWPPIPGPDPLPYREMDFIKDGALDETVLSARRDLEAIRTLPEAELAEYIGYRPYLYCTCGTATKVAQGLVNPDGSFNICWSDYGLFPFLNCHDEYAFVVKQIFNGQTITIYDGVAANKWFDYGDDVKLVSYHPEAHGCRHNDPPVVVGDPFVMLQDIGLTESYHLKTPDATGWDRVASPGYNDGLAFPAANAADALGKLKDRNWGGTLLLRYFFSEDMNGLGAEYYRISISAADAAGNPTGPRKYLSAGVSWSKYVSAGTGINIENESLGPVSVGTENNLFLIPYDDDGTPNEAWLSGQYHGKLVTTDFDRGQHLLTVEVFNAAGQRLRPNGAGGAGKDEPFKFIRWYQETGPTADVPFAALTHMFWWDNRRVEAEIVDLRKNNVESTAECQFISGQKNSLFSAGYRAYHPEPIFQLYHRMWWRRGLGGPTGNLVSNSPNNVGQPPALPGVSGTETFENMLGTHKKCSFSLHLSAYVKTFNGIGRLNSLDDWDQAAFALEIGGPP